MYTRKREKFNTFKTITIAIILLAMFLLIISASAKINDIDGYGKSTPIIAEAAAQPGSGYGIITAANIGSNITILPQNGVVANDRYRMGLQTTWQDGLSGIDFSRIPDGNNLFRLDWSDHADKQMYHYARFQLDDDVVNLRRSGSLRMSVTIRMHSTANSDLGGIGIGKKGLKDDNITKDSTMEDILQTVPTLQSPGGWAAFWGSSVWTINEDLAYTDTDEDRYVYAIFIAQASGGASYAFDNFYINLSYKEGSVVRGNKTFSKVDGIAPSTIGTESDAAVEYVKDSVTGTFSTIGTTTYLSFDAIDTYYTLRAKQFGTGYRFVGWAEIKDDKTINIERKTPTYLSGYDINSTLAEVRTAVQAATTGITRWLDGTPSGDYNTVRIGRVEKPADSQYRIQGGRYFAAIYVPVFIKFNLLKRAPRMCNTDNGLIQVLRKH